MRKFMIAVLVAVAMTGCGCDDTQPPATDAGQPPDATVAAPDALTVTDATVTVQADAEPIHDAGQPDGDGINRCNPMATCADGTACHIAESPAVSSLYCAPVGPTPDGQPCGMDADCMAGSECAPCEGAVCPVLHALTCLKTCRYDADCGAGHFCNYGQLGSTNNGVAYSVCY